MSSYKVNKNDNELDEFIYEQREKGLTYGAIAEKLAKQGIRTSEGTVRLKALKIYELRGDKDPKSNERRLIVDKKIYELREKGLTYRAITEFLIKEGIEIQTHTVRERCKMMYRSKRKKEPEKTYASRLRNEITDEEIYEEREKGLTYKEIAKKFNEEGRTISLDTVRLRCKTIYRIKKQNEPRSNMKSIKYDEDISEIDVVPSIFSKEELLEQILKLGKTKGANMEQLEYIASLYGIDLEGNKEVIESER